ncbi:MAG: alkaline phosphatase family protein, partial [Sphingobacteriia bacterium]
LMASLNAGIKEKFGVENAVVSMFNYQVSFNHDKMDSLKANKKDIIDYVVQEVKRQETVLTAFPTANILTSSVPQLLREKLANGYLPQRCGDVQIILKSGYIDGGATGTTHGLWYAYDSHIPLLWYGWKIPQGRSAQLVNMADIAPTVAALLGIQEPSGNVGKPIPALVK